MIYLIVCKETYTCKIGYSINPLKRLKELQTGNPFLLEVYGTINAESNYEKHLHNKFNAYKINNE